MEEPHRMSDRCYRYRGIFKDIAVLSFTCGGFISGIGIICLHIQ